MKWRGRRTSANIEDRRGGRGGRVSGGAKIGGIGAIVVLLIGAFLGVDTSFLLGGAGLQAPVATAPSGPNAIDDDTEEFVGVVLADTEAVWAEIFARSGGRYDPPALVLFDGRVSSACGLATAASGPFYCPADRKAYLDTAFFRTLSGRLGAGGDFAAAYVIAHEVAHHVQNELGILPEVNARRARVSKVEANDLSVRIELQADCFSGIWARHVHERFGVLERGDIQEALNAASRIGDDTLQRAAGRAVVPDSFTHGTSEQRMRWFETGFRSGDPNDCDTFGTRTL